MTSSSHFGIVPGKNLRFLIFCPMKLNIGTGVNFADVITRRSEV